MNQVAIIEAKDLVSFDQEAFASYYDELRKRYRIENPDVSTEDGRQQIRSNAYKVAQEKAELARRADALKADAQKTIKTINEEKSKAIDKMQALQDEIRKPLTEFETKEKTRIEAHENRILEIQCLKDMPGDAPLEMIDDHINRLAAYDGISWDEFENRALVAISQTKKILSDFHEKRANEIKDAEDLARLRKQEEERAQKERDDLIAKEAAEKARKEAEALAAMELVWEQAHRDNAEFDRHLAARREQEAKERAETAEWLSMYAEAFAENVRIDNEKRAEEQRIAEEQRLKDEAERREWLDMYAEADGHNKALDAQAEQRRRDEDAAKKREADLEHKKKINNEARNALQAIVDAGKLGDDPMKDIVVAIAQGKIPHVSIKY